MGMPCKLRDGEAGENQYETADVIAWIIRQETKQGMDKETEAAKLLKAQTEAQERKNRRESGETIDLAVAKAVVQRAIFAIRQKMVTMPLPLQTRQGMLADLKTLEKTDLRAIKDAEDANSVEEEL